MVQDSNKNNTLKHCKLSGTVALGSTSKIIATMQTLLNICQEFGHVKKEVCLQIIV